MENPWHTLIRQQQKSEDVVGLQQAIDALVDESNGAFKLLLPDLTHAHILYIGEDSRDTSTNLARSCRLVTALFTSENSHAIQQEKNQLRQDPENLELARLKSIPLDFPEATFDGVVIDTALCQTEEYHPSTLMLEIKRILKPSAWIFLKCKNRISRESIFDSLSNTRLHSLFGYRQLLNRIGFGYQQAFGFDSLNQGADRIVRLTNSKQAYELKNHGKRRYLPLWLCHLTMPSFGILAGASAHPPCTLDNIIEQAANEMRAQAGHEIVSIEVNRKGKFVVALDIQKPEARRVTLKIPLTENAKQHLQHNHAGLLYLQQAMISSDKTRLSTSSFPYPICSGHFQNIPYYVESFIQGKPFTKSGDKNTMHQIVRQIEHKLIALRNIPFPQDLKPAHTMLEQQVNAIRAYILEETPSLLEKFDQIARPILQGEREANATGHFFFKSDFSISNTLVEGDTVTGLIDFDFWGVSHNKLIDYADFVFSFTRNFYNHDYADCLVMINSSALSSIGQFLNIEETIAELGGTVKEFKEASVIAWLNSVCHILEFERTRRNNKRIELVLINPILKLAQLDQFKNPAHH